MSRSRTAGLASLLLCLFLGALDQTAVATALPTISAEFGTDAALSWVMAVYLVTAAVSTPLWGSLSDAHGRRPLLMLAVVIFMVASVGAALAPDIVPLIAARAVQGIGGGGMIVLSFTAIADMVSPRERGRYIGLFGAVFGAASVLGPVVGGILTQAASWRWIFLINIPLGLLAVGMIMLRLRLTNAQVRTRVDFVGAALLTLAVSAIMLGLLSAAPTIGWPRLLSAGLVALGVLATVLFVVVERRTAHPLLPLSVLGHPVVATAATLSAIVGLTTLGAIVYIPVYLQGALGSSPSASGLQLLPFVGATLLSAVIVGRAISRSGTYRGAPLAGAAIAAVGFFGLTRVDAESPYALTAVALTMAGVGLGAILPALTVSAQSAVPEIQVGVVTSVTSLSRSLGSALGATAFGLVSAIVISAQVSDTAAASPEVIARSTQVIFSVSALVMLVAIVLAWRMPVIPLRQRTALSPE